VEAMRRFAIGLYEDHAAVKAGVTLPWSTGPWKGTSISGHEPIKRQNLQTYQAIVRDPLLTQNSLNEMLWGVVFQSARRVSLSAYACPSAKRRGKDPCSP
jgi:hypothetical protein